MAILRGFPICPFLSTRSEFKTTGNYWLDEIKVEDDIVSIWHLRQRFGFPLPECKSIQASLRTMEEKAVIYHLQGKQNEENR